MDGIQGALMGGAHRLGSCGGAYEIKLAGEDKKSARAKRTARGNPAEMSKVQFAK